MEGDETQLGVLREPCVIFIWGLSWALANASGLLVLVLPVAQITYGGGCAGGCTAPSKKKSGARSPEAAIKRLEIREPAACP